MLLCPFAEYKASPNHGGPIGTILGVVEHVTAGESDPWGTFANPANQVSSHFGIMNGKGGTADGHLEQYVPCDVTAWAEAAGNGHYISIETEGVPTEALTDAQVKTFAAVYAWCHQQFGVPFVITDTPGAKGLITHGDGGAAWGGHTGCPGPLRKAQRQAVLDLAQGSTPPPPAKEGHMLRYTNSGKGYWIVHTDGSVWSFGDAHYLGGSNAGAVSPLPAGQTAVGFDVISVDDPSVPTQPPGFANPAGQGYVIEASGGGLYTFGTSRYLGNVADTLAEIFPAEHAAAEAAEREPAQ